MQTRGAVEQRKWAIQKLHNSGRKEGVIKADKGDHGTENVGQNYQPLELEGSSEK